MIRPILEVCVSSTETGAMAVEWGADRLELCNALQLGGLTPQLSMLKTLRKTNAPIGVLVRCRPGHFVYTRSEKDLMLDQATSFLDAGADFLALGGLTETHHLDEDFLDQVGRHLETKKLVFHRAFDFVIDPLEATTDLADRGFLRILTSGENALRADPIGQLKDLVTQAANRIGILPCGGIRAHNASNILKETGATELHASCLKKTEHPQNGMGHLELLDKTALVALRMEMDFALPQTRKSTLSNL